VRSATISSVPPRVLIVDDHAGFRSMASRLLQAGGYDVVGEAIDGTSAVIAVRELQPEIVLLDVQLPDVDGCEVARTLAASDDPPAVVLISSREAGDYGPRLTSCGARGFLAKSGLSAAALDVLLRAS
jgi:DNA-binding NarL/FixJ family response regulator